MSLTELTLRIQRLERLGIQMAREYHRVAKGELRLYYVERQTYLQAIQKLIGGIEDARIALEKAQHRFEEAKRPNE